MHKHTRADGWVHVYLRVCVRRCVRIHGPTHRRSPAKRYTLTHKIPNLTQVKLSRIIRDQRIIQRENIEEKRGREINKEKKGNR